MDYSPGVEMIVCRFVRRPTKEIASRMNQGDPFTGIGILRASAQR